jgi:hypothetical protein
MKADDEMTQDSEEQDETMNCGLGVAERELLHEKLRLLPETVPPRAVWQRIEAQAWAEGLFRAHGVRAPFKWLGGAGLAATVVLAVLNFDIVPTRSVPADGGERSFPTEPEPVYTARDRSVRLRTLNALMVESQQLEQDLRLLPDEPQVVRAGTVATLAAVEDQIAAIDYRLNAPLPMTHAEMELYWRERVRLMNLLVQLRTAQAQRNAF